ncbi:MAG TPA: ARMT1-like domain-containing protein [Methanoregula sp.]|nr:ARMT1-like domain-containing protein [Methanoregula sp.]
MKITEHCIDCLLSRVNLECSLCRASPSLADTTMAECSRIMNEIRSAPLSHPQIASRIHRRAYEVLGNSDPFAELKASGNQQAQEVCKKICSELSTFRDFALASVIGNTFDYGVKGHIVEENFYDFFKKEFDRGFFIDDTDKIAPLCDRVVYLSDNCGEIVLDRLFIEYLRSQNSHITLAVKEAPILNDATLADAKELGLDTCVDILTTTGGGAEIGICMENIPDNLRKAISRCTIIIAKGMANFESLSEMSNLPPIAYLMAAKCKPVADEVGVPVGSKIAMLRTG